MKEALGLSSKKRHSPHLQTQKKSEGTRYICPRQRFIGITFQLIKLIEMAMVAKWSNINFCSEITIQSRSGKTFAFLLQHYYTYKIMQSYHANKYILLYLKVSCSALVSSISIKAIISNT